MFVSGVVVGIVGALTCVSLAMRWAVRWLPLDDRSKDMGPY